MNGTSKALSLDEAMEEYLLYNEELTSMIKSLNNVLAEDAIGEDDYDVIINFREFIPIDIRCNSANSISSGMVSDMVYEVFKDNYEDGIDDLDLYEGSDNYLSIIKTIGTQADKRGPLLVGLHRFIEFSNQIDDLEQFYEDTLNVLLSELENQYTEYFGVDLDAFLKNVSSKNRDNEKVAMINAEIKRINLLKLNITDYRAHKFAQDYIRHIQDRLDIYKKYGDSTVDFLPDLATLDNDAVFNEDIDFADDSGGSASNNKHHTIMRKSLALYYILNEVSDSLLVDGNKRAVARFFSFLTGNNEDNIYKGFPKMHEGLDKPNSPRRKDFEFVIAELEKINLGEVSDKMRRDTKG